VDAPGLLPAVLQLGQGSGEPTLALLPLGRGPQDFGAARAAERGQVRVAGLLHEAHDRGRPLLEPAGVEGDLCGDRSGAIDIPDRPEVDRFAGSGGGHGFVEPGHPLVDPAEGDLGQSDRGQTGELEIGVMASTADGERFLGMAERGGRIERAFGLNQGHPAPLGRVRGDGEEVSGPSQPAVRHGLVPQGVGVLPAEEEGHAGGPFVVAGAAESRVGLLPRLDRPGDVGEPPSSLG